VTNAERIAKFIAEYGEHSLLIHTIPKTPFWLIFQKTPKSEDRWRVILCNPNNRTWRLINENVSDEQHEELWNQLLLVNIGRRITIKEATHTLQKHTDVYLKKYNHKKIYEHKLRSSRRIS
jgi:hypothetical protein